MEITREQKVAINNDNFTICLINGSPSMLRGHYTGPATDSRQQYINFESLPDLAKFLDKGIAALHAANLEIQDKELTDKVIRVRK